MKKERFGYIISLFLTFIPFNHDGIIIFILGILFSFLFIRMRKFGMPYYIAFLSLAGIYILTFFLLNIFGSKNLFYSFNLIAIVILSYFLPFESKDVIKYTFLFLISIALLKNLTNPIFPIITFMISLKEIFSEQKNKKIIIFIFSFFIIFSIWNFNYYYNPFTEINSKNEKNIESNYINDSNNEITISKLSKESKRNFVGNITIMKNKSITKNIDTIIFFYIFIGAIIAFISAFYTWNLYTKNEKKKIIVSIIIFFLSLGIMGSSIAYLSRGRDPISEHKLGNINIDSKNDFSNNKIISFFSEGIKNPKNVFIKIHSEIIFAIISILLVVALIIYIYKFHNKQKKEENNIEDFSMDNHNNENIPFLIDEGYKYIRKRFFNSYPHLTPYELLNNINYPNEFELLTNLFVIKEYGEKNFSYTKKEIKNIIEECIRFFEKNDFKN
ncbi:hypothetical protein [Marinitoga sp. 38H-ov]|uniref:hypothetical protein n=1 Tax=Marinitoga sp. 38H-ov TaxID=1755814 RepID=UPI0013EE03BE|nr:hypothetical protein [Marinitoga sp. 38H-ov]KAF2955625.1 hypothetical protein AS160_00480 [Marinitoga sp. 38H-ov]